MNLWSIAAAVLAFGTGLGHLFWGGREVARPLLASRELTFESRILAYYCWHITTIVIFGMAGAFLYAGLAASGRDFAIAATALAAAFALLNVALVVWTRSSPRVLPQWAFFSGIAALGAVASV